MCVSQDCSLQAQSNLSYLSILKEPCEELAQLKPSQVAPKLRHIVSLIRIIWVNSDYYNTSERITGLFRKVPAFYYIHYCHKHTPFEYTLHTQTHAAIRLSYF